MGFEETLNRTYELVQELQKQLSIDQSRIPEELLIMPLTIDQAAPMLNISYWTAKRYVETGKVQGFRQGKKWFTTYKSILDYRKNIVQAPQGCVLDQGEASERQTSLSSRGRRSTRDNVQESNPLDISNQSCHDRSEAPVKNPISTNYSFKNI